MKVRLCLHARKLEKLRFTRRSNPYATVSSYTGDIHDAHVLGKTEVVRNTQDPIWCKPIIIDYEYGRSTKVKVSVFDKRRKPSSASSSKGKPMETSDKPMGKAVVFDIDSVLQNNTNQNRGDGGVVTQKLPDNGWIFLQANIIPEGIETRRLVLSLEGRDLLEDSGAIRSSELRSFYEICRKNQESSGKAWARPVYRSEVAKGSYRPKWRRTAINTDWLCDGDEKQEIQVTVYEYKKSGGHVHIGTSIVSVDALCKFNRMSINKHGKNTGRLKIVEAVILDEDPAADGNAVGLPNSDDVTFRSIASAKSATTDYSFSTAASGKTEGSTSVGSSTVSARPGTFTHVLHIAGDGSSAKSAKTPTSPSVPKRSSLDAYIMHTKKTSGENCISSRKSQARSHKSTSTGMIQSSRNGGLPRTTAIPITESPTASSSARGTRRVRHNSLDLLHKIHSSMSSEQSDCHSPSGSKSLKKGRSNSFDFLSQIQSSLSTEQQGSNSPLERKKKAQIAISDSVEYSTSASYRSINAPSLPPSFSGMKKPERVRNESVGSTMTAPPTFSNTNNHLGGCGEADYASITKPGKNRSRSVGVTVPSPSSVPPSFSGMKKPERVRNESVSSTTTAPPMFSNTKKAHRMNNEFVGSNATIPLSTKKPERRRSKSVGYKAAGPLNLEQSKARNIRRSISSPVETITVELMVHARDLKNLSRLCGVSDPYAVLSLIDSSGKNVRVLGRTEVIDNCLDPVWCEPTLVEYVLGTEVVVDVSIYDKNEHHEDKPMGSAKFEVGSVLSASTGIKAKRLPDNAGWIFVQAEKVAKRTEELLNLSLVGRNLINVEGMFGGKSDPFFVLSKKDSNGSWRAVYRSEHVPNDLNPSWKRVKVNFQRLCDSDSSRPFLLSIHDYETSGKHRDMGSIETSVDGLIEAYGFDSAPKSLELKKDGKISGCLEVKRAYVGRGSRRRASRDRTATSTVGKAQQKTHPARPSRSPKNKSEPVAELDPQRQHPEVHQVTAEDETKPVKVKADTHYDNVAENQDTEDWASEYAEFMKQQRRTPTQHCFPRVCDESVGSFDTSPTSNLSMHPLTSLTPSRVAEITRDKPVSQRRYEDDGGLRDCLVGRMKEFMKLSEEKLLAEDAILS